MEKWSALLGNSDAVGSLTNVRNIGGLGGLSGLTSGMDTGLQDAINIILGLMSPHVLPMAEKKISQLLSSIQNTECVDAMAAYVDGVISLTPQFWALRMVDSTGKLPESFPTGATAILGDYDECVGTQATSFSGQYCLLTACFAPGYTFQPCTRDPVEPAAKFHLTLRDQLTTGVMNWTALLHAGRGLPVRLGLCLPSACSAEDVLALSNKASEIVFPMVRDFVRFELTDRDCRTLDDEVFEGYDYLAIFILIFIALMVGLGTAYQHATRAHRGARNVVMMAFSATRNIKRLFDTSVVEEALPAVDGVRVLSLLWIVCCHALFVAGHLPVANGDRIPDYLNYGYIAVIGSAFLSVDTFLVMSGMLVSYVYLRRSSTGRSVNIIGYYLHRIVRLLPSLGLIMFLQSTILLKLRDGPIWRLQPAQQCPETWWYILLHICNYFRPETVQCMVHLWYLSLDWQLYVLAPLALFWFRRRPRQVLTSMLFLGIAGVVLRFWVAYSGDHVTPWGGHYSRRTMEAVYFPTHMRFVPYLMGLALGYEIHRVRHLKYPPSFSQTGLSAMQVGWPLLLTGSIGWVHRHMGLEPPPEPFAEALHIALVDVTWAAGISMLLYLCAIGNGGPVGQMLSMGWWRPLGSLSYGVYLLHIPLFDSFTQDTRQLIRLDLWRLWIAGVGCFFVVHIPAMALWMGVDAPLAYIVNSFTNPSKGERKRKPHNGLSSGEKSARNMDYFEISNGETKKGKHLNI